MYQDPKRVRRHKQTIYLDEYEAAIVEAHANYSGESKATIMRQMVIDKAREDLGLAPSTARPMVAKRGT